MHSTSFTQILRETVLALPGALGAIFIDWEGEVVDEYSPFMDNMELRLVGAHWGIPYCQLLKAFRQNKLDPPDELVLRFTRQHVILRRVTEHYWVLLALGQKCNLALAQCLLQRASEQLKTQM